MTVNVVIESYRKTDANKNHTVAIAFSGLKIIDFIRQPNDYSAGEFMDWLSSKYDDSFMILDNRGCGIEYYDYMDGKFFYNSSNLNTSAAFLIKDSVISEFMINSIFDQKKKIDFKHMMSQMGNLSIVERVNHGNFRLKSKPNNEDTGFARCILTYIAYMGE
jgi:hypothetical protein